MPISWTSGLRQAQQAALDFCISFTKCAISLFEPTGDGKIRLVLPLGQLEPYCKKLQTFPEGDRLCHDDHVRRAKQVIESGQPILALCHAGVFNPALPIVVDGKVRAVLVYGQMWVEGDERCTEARDRHEGVIARLQPPEDDELELSVYYDEIKKFSRRDLDALSQQMSSLQHLFYEMMSREQELDRQTESTIHDLQIRLQPVLAHAQNLYNDLGRITTEHPLVGNLLATAEESLGSVLAMRTLVRNLGNFMPEYQFKLCSLEALVEEAVLTYKAEAERKEVDIRVWLEGPSKIEMSREHLQQAISNLMHNAIKYSFSGRHGRYRFVDIRGKTDEPDYLLTFSNYGVGILPEELDRIFEPGYKGELTRKEYRSGSGMGLAITKEVIERHHGTIEIESVETGGDAYVSRFSIRLPLKQPTEEEVNENHLD